MPLLIQKHWFTKEEIQANPDKIYVFGDNESREGVGGQAKACRGQPNTIGIRTKRDKYRNTDSYWYDDTYNENITMVIKDFLKVLKAIDDGKTVVFPLDGFGTGLANLKDNAPKTLEFIEFITNACIKEINGEYIE
jgi:hypothetical protein